VRENHVLPAWTDHIRPRWQLRSQTSRSARRSATGQGRRASRILWAGRHRVVIWHREL